MDEVIQQSPIPQQTPIQPEMPPKNSSSNWLRTLAIGFGIVSIGTAIAVGGYFLGTKNSQPPIKTVTVSPSQTTVDTKTQFIDQKQISETVNWNVYVDPQDIFSIKYPPTFNVKDESSQSSSFGIFLSSTTPEMQAYYIKLLQSTMSLNDYLRDPAKNLVGINNVRILNNEFMIASQKSKGIGLGIQMYFIKKGNNIVEIYGSSPVWTDSDLKIFNQILSTFRFAN